MRHGGSRRGRPPVSRRLRGDLPMIVIRTGIVVPVLRRDLMRGRSLGRRLGRPPRLGPAQQRLELVKRAAHLGGRHRRRGRGRLGRNDAEARLLTGRLRRRRTPLREDGLQGIVLPDDARQLGERVALLAGTRRLTRGPELTLQILEVERKTVSCWLTHGTIHSSTSRLSITRQAKTRAVNLTLCAPAEKRPSAHLFRRRNSGDSQTGSKNAAHRMHERQSRQGRLSISLINEP